MVSEKRIKKDAAVELHGAGWSFEAIHSVTGLRLDVCEFCGGTATQFCDGRPYQTLYNRPGTKRAWKTPDEYWKTCDRSMCRACAVSVQVSFYSCLDEPEEGAIDTTDLCPNCIRLGLGKRYGYIR